MAKKKTHGGARKKAGRKPVEDKKRNEQGEGLQQNYLQAKG